MPRKGTKKQQETDVTEEHVGTEEITKLEEEERKRRMKEEKPSEDSKAVREKVVKMEEDERQRRGDEEENVLKAMKLASVHKELKSRHHRQGSINLSHKEPKSEEGKSSVQQKQELKGQAKSKVHHEMKTQSGSKSDLPVSSGSLGLQKAKEVEEEERARRLTEMALHHPKMEEQELPKSSKTSKTSKSEKETQKSHPPTQSKHKKGSLSPTLLHLRKARQEDIKLTNQLEEEERARRLTEMFAVKPLQEHVEKPVSLVHPVLAKRLSKEFEKQQKMSEQNRSLSRKLEEEERIRRLTELERRQRGLHNVLSQSGNVETA